jgi:hypothetical protein
MGPAWLCREMIRKNEASAQVRYLKNLFLMKGALLLISFQPAASLTFNFVIAGIAWFWSVILRKPVPKEWW